nr:vegetative cell wall protein gp1-like [Aegilops tauschii subsp. strangulata]
MSSSLPTPSLPLPTVTTAPLPSPSAPLVASSGAATAQMLAPSTAPPPAVYTPEEITGVLNDLVTAVQGIWLYLASPYGPPPPLLLTATAGPPALSWYSLHPRAFAAFAGTLPPQLQLPPAAAPQWPKWPASAPAAPPAPIAAPAPPWLPPHQAAFAALAGPLQQPLQLPSIATTAQPWLQWQPLLPWRPPSRPALRRSSRCPVRHRRSRCSCSSHRQSAPAPIDRAGGSPAPPSPVPAVAVTASVLDRYPPRVGGGEAAGYCAQPPSVSDLDLIHCAGDLGHAVSPTGSGHAVFPAGRDLKVCDIGGWGAHPSSSFSIASPPLFPVRCRPTAVRQEEGMVSPTAAHHVAPLHSVTGCREGASAGHSCDQFQVVLHMHSFCPDGVHGIQVDVHVHV